MQINLAPQKLIDNQFQTQSVHTDLIPSNLPPPPYYNHNFRVLFIKVLNVDQYMTSSNERGAFLGLTSKIYNYQVPNWHMIILYVDMNPANCIWTMPYFYEKHWHGPTPGVGFPIKIE